jgi:O-antigen/teichoic acid export membrane protein
VARDSRIRTRTLVARNTAWNLLGALLPIPVALVSIPVLVKALGVERFGVLGLAWMVLGYFGMFDFGLAQSTTKFVSVGVARGERENLRALALGSALLHAALGVAGAVIFALLVPWLTASVFKLPASLVHETQGALYWLAASVPAIVVTAALRGVLEGLQRFDIVNAIRIPASIANYAGPLVALYFGTELSLIVAVIVVARFAVLGAYALACAALLPSDPGSSGLDGAQLIRLAAYGGWLAASNLVNPLIIAADRFAIAAAVSVSAVAFYATPYEIITKGWILSASLLGALFPVFSAMAASEPGAIRAACRSAQRTLLAVAAPAIASVLGCADLLLQWWLGAEFRDNSTTVARLLALGILVNIVAQAPLTALNAIGRADVTAKIAALELPFYAAAIWYGAARYGINGAAAIWAARAVVDALALFLAAHAVLPKEAPEGRTRGMGLGSAALLCGFIAAAWLIAYAYRENVAARFGMLAVLLAALIVWEWRVLLTRDDRENLRELRSRLLMTRTQ